MFQFENASLLKLSKTIQYATESIISIFDCGEKCTNKLNPLLWKMQY